MFSASPRDEMAILPISIQLIGEWVNFRYLRPKIEYKDGVKLVVDFGHDGGKIRFFSARVLCLNLSMQPL